MLNWYNMFTTLDDPTKVWERIFENLSVMARRVLLAVASLPTEVFLEDVRDAVQSLSPKDFDAGEFRNAIGMVEGTFIDVLKAEPDSKGHQSLVVIRDPSVRDYLWARLEVVEGEADALVRSAIFFEQCVILYEGQNHIASMPAMVLPRTHIGTRNRTVVSHEAVVSRAAGLIDSTSPLVRQQRSFEIFGTFHREQRNLEQRTSFLMAVLAAHRDSRVVASSANTCLARTADEWEAGRGSHIDGLELLNQAMKIEDLIDADVLERAGRALLGLTISRLQQSEDFEALVRLATVNPGLFAEPQRSLESWSSEFEHFLDGERSWLLEELDDPDHLEEEMMVISEIALEFGMDISDLEFDTERRIEELRSEWGPDFGSDIPRLYSNPTDKSGTGQIDTLFQSLR